MATIHTRIEKIRGCGYRKPGGKYLVSGEPAKYCGKLPIELSVCPCCNQGIKFSRSFQWIQMKLIEDAPCRLKDDCRCSAFEQPWNFGPEEKIGLMWVGEKHYKTPGHFLKEANTMGISKRIATMPKDLVVGETWILLAHIKAIPGEEPKPAIFQAFRPTAVEYVITGEESEEELDKLEQRGYTIVKVENPEANSQLQIGEDGSGSN